MAQGKNLEQFSLVITMAHGDPLQMSLLYKLCQHFSITRTILNDDYHSQHVCSVQHFREKIYNGLHTRISFLQHP